MINFHGEIPLAHQHARAGFLRGRPSIVAASPPIQPGGSVRCRWRSPRIPRPSAGFGGKGCGGLRVRSLSVSQATPTAPRACPIPATPATPTACGRPGEATETSDPLRARGRVRAGFSGNSHQMCEALPPQKKVSANRRPLAPARPQARCIARGAPASARLVRWPTAHPSLPDESVAS